MARPYWSGQIQISLVSFGVKLFVATESKSEIRFHQINRKTGERVRHQKVAASSIEDNPGEAAEAIDKGDIVKGYEYRKGEYVMIEPKELEELRIPSKHAIEVSQFIDLNELTPEYMEKPYFIVPEDDVQTEAYTVVRAALKKSKKAALGKIAFGGREHVFAITASEDDKLGGMMGYTMRYQDELRDPAEYFKDIKKVAVNQDSLELALELIKRKATKFEPNKFKDQYEAAVRELVEAKIQNLPIPKEEEAAPRRGQVINLMDALRKSVGGKEVEATSSTKKKPSSSVRSAASKEKEGISLVKPGKSSGKRKSA
ncbi:non-homologous end joining protein Ku [Edaphobacter albus]|uniref:non-homologous end joining protein Ku n=1 Tax=Edaphobacter sp. 4G125 TaxID=2763071 RepID=UPI0016492886|nr:Ku protein [Edaphobacter sp. 4G125]QNI35669.1 Ku protein [Edaphobacter sp. 4G125]